MSSVQRQSSSGSDGSVVDDKKRKKMQSNRESARRSRMKKQKRVEELTVEISRLQISNGQIGQSIDAKDKAYSEVEAWNNVMRAQEKELTDRLRYLESIEQTFVEFSGVFDEDINNDMAEMQDSLLNPWQLPYSTQPITASSADMFLDWP
ncbi:putative transcription factor bZIP family [Rosa chinensis]|uniref:Putative transcription factor bZIP family n=1 Tax=Rosa chinensis TaxID=74649 RepID=A0A2P6PI82_ROSCH|nr:bZIP transcription factor 53 [Rosa chinensis]PRQ21637.1 putative transcription factor bZIP family [Rosa chinensis]